MARPNPGEPNAGHPADNPATRTAELAERDPCLGILFVHGAGDHGVGSTLIEFGEPIIAWLDGWLSAGRRGPTDASDLARPGATQLLVREADAHAPAHTEVRIRTHDDDTPHLWLMAEARWDEAFTPPAFRQVLTWAIGVVPWTVLTQFIGPVIDESRLLSADLFSILRWLVNVSVAAVLALVVAVVVQAFALALLILSIIPLDAVRDVVSRLQRFASTSVGDLYMVLTSPVQRAALTGAVQRDIDWLRARGCRRIAVVAHSQGGYVAYQALADPYHRDVELFVTFGSGLIRLTESEQARRTGWLPLGLIGVIGALLAVRFGPVAILGTLDIWEKRQASGLAFLIGAAMTVGFVVALRRYLTERSPVPDLPVRTPWLDLVTNEDPVLNGSRAGRLPGRVHKVRIQNRASVVADHGSYWQNLDQFVSRVTLRIAALDRDGRIWRAGPIPDARDAVRHLRRSWHRRRARVATLQRARGPIAVATAVLVAARADQLDAVGQAVAGWFRWFPAAIVAWLPDVIGSAIPIVLSHAQYLGLGTILALSYLAYQAGLALWRWWGAADTEAQYRGVLADPVSARALVYYGWTIAHIAVLAIVALVGPAAVLTWLGGVTRDLDPIVQAWARVYTWSLVTAAVVGAVLWGRRVPAATATATAWRPPRWLVGGTVVAVLVELALALLRPGPTPAILSIPGGIALELTSLALAALAGAPSGRTVRWLVLRVQRRLDRRHPSGATASVVDRLGVLGLVLALGAIGLILQPIWQAWLVGGVIALVGLLLAVSLATNVSGTKLPGIGDVRSSPAGLRQAGAGGVVVAALVIGAAIARGGLLLLGR
ncbi:MAG TPA: hypothetical protein VFI34_00350 [Candidatus Limnocylindrales bacterium]|nr:hypothetical protein [Candidatus Limnocylindrales bacterium]